MSICSKPEVYFIDSDKDGVKSVFLPVMKEVLKAMSFLKRKYQNPL